MHFIFVVYMLILGIISGICTGLPYGPVGFVIIRRFYLFGMKSGMLSAAGSVMADAFYAVVVGFGLHRISHFLLSVAVYAEAIAGLALLYIGIHSMTIKLHLHDGSEENHPFEDITSAMFLNALNPTLIFSFGLVFTIMANITHGAGLSWEAIVVFIFGIAVGTLGLWYLFGKGIHWLRDHNRDSIVQKINYITGAILAILGLGLLLLAMVKYF